MRWLGLGNAKSSSDITPIDLFRNLGGVLLEPREVRSLISRIPNYSIDRVLSTFGRSLIPAYKA